MTDISREEDWRIRYYDPEPTDIIEREKGHDINLYIDKILKAKAKNPELDKDPDIQTAAAIILVAGMDVNSLLRGKPDVEPLPAIHGDSPTEVKFIKLAVPHIIKKNAIHLSNDQIDVAIAQLNNARRPTCPTK